MQLSPARQPRLKTEQMTPFCNQLWLRYRYSLNIAYVTYVGYELKQLKKIKNQKIKSNKT
jgi:hypothetical protein